MKKIYETLEMYITEFETEDIITSSEHNMENATCMERNRVQVRTEENFK